MNVSWSVSSLKENAISCSINGKCLRKIGAKGQFKDPCGVTYLNDDEILIADTNNGRIQQINIQTGTVMKTLGKMGVGIGEFYHPTDVRLDEERRMVVTEMSRNRIQVMSREGETISIFRNFGPDKSNTQRAACLTKKSFSSPIGKIIALKLSTSQEHSYTSLANEAIKIDNLTTRMVCL